MVKCSLSRRYKLFFLSYLNSAFIFVFFLVLLSNCNNSEGNQRLGSKSSDTLLKKIDSSSIKSTFIDIYPVVNYKLDTIKTNKQLSAIKSKYKDTPENKNANKIFTLLNRKELRFISKGSAVIIPDSIFADPKVYSIFPQEYPGAKSIKKILLVSNKYMAYGCYEYGKLVRFAACNPGKEKTPSYPGRYAFAWKEKLHRSSIDSNWVMPFTFNFHTEAGSAFHQFEMPGKPASHSCIRQFYDDAEWLFSWAEGIKRDSNRKFIPLSGTPVIIIDHYDFAPGKGQHWKKLKSNKDVLLDLPSNPMEVEEALIPISQIPVDARGNLRNISRYKTAEDTLRARGVIREGIKLIETKNFNKLRREKEKKKLKK